MAPALVALAAALAAYVMVKFFGVIFLGQPREPGLARAHDAGMLERIGLVWLALGCLLLGLLPTHVIGALRTVAAELSGGTLPPSNAPWWLLVPLPGSVPPTPRWSSSPRSPASSPSRCSRCDCFYHRRVRRAAAWDCGFGVATPACRIPPKVSASRSATSSAAFFAMQRELPSPFDRAPRYRVTVGDRLWQGLYLPLGGLVQRLADAFAWLQQGRIATYLLYSFVTLIALLALVL